MEAKNGYGFPEGWIEQLRPLLGASLPDFLRALNEPPLRGVRTRKGTAPPPEECTVLMSFPSGTN